MQLAYTRTRDVLRDCRPQSIEDLNRFLAPLVLDGAITFRLVWRTLAAFRHG